VGEEIYNRLVVSFEKTQQVINQIEAKLRKIIGLCGFLPSMGRLSLFR